MAILDLWGQWIWFAGAALGLATVLVSLVYVLSEMLMNDKMKIWAKMELVEIFYSAVIISMAIGGLPIIDSVVHGALVSGGAPGGPAGPLSTWIYVQGPGGMQPQLLNLCGDGIAAAVTSPYHDIDSCHMRLSIWYLREVFDEAKSFAFDIYLSYILTSMIAEFTINIEFLFEKAGFFTFNPWRGFFTMGNTIKALVFDWAIKIMMITKFQEILLSFIAKALFPALFVIGAILRTFSFTRRLGGLLLAMALALYFIYPAFYAFGALAMLGIKTDSTVVSAWLSPSNDQNPGNRDADPSTGPQDYPNPQIANTMYMVGDYAMIGGDGNFSSGEALQSMRRYEGASANEYFGWMEEREQNTTIHFDLTDSTNHTDQEYNDSYRTAYDKGQDWFNTVSKQGKFDNFVTFAWEPNGPIETLSRLTFWSVFFALFSIIGTIAGIRSLSITFGGDIEIAGLTRLI